MNKLAGLSALEQYLNKHHPILSQIISQFISSALVAIFMAIWAINNVPPNPVLNKEVSKDSSQIVIKNEGILPSNAFYNVITENTVTIKPDIKLGNAHVEVTPASQDKYKIQLKDLPKNQSVVIFFNTGNIKIDQK